MTRKQLMLEAMDLVIEAVRGVKPSPKIGARENAIVSGEIRAMLSMIQRRRSVVSMQEEEEEV